MKTTLFYLLTLLIPVFGLKADIITHLSQLNSSQIQKHAFVLIDLQGGGENLDGSPDFHNNTRKALGKCFKKGVFITSFNNRRKKNEPDIPSINTTPEDILPKEMRREGKFLRFKKKENSIFSNKHFKRIMQEKGIDTLIISGVFTNACVEASAIDALNSNFTVVLAFETVSSVASQPTYNWLASLNIPAFLNPSMDEVKLKQRNREIFLQTVDTLQKLNSERLMVICTPSRNETKTARNPDDDSDEHDPSEALGACAISY